MTKPSIPLQPCTLSDTRIFQRQPIQYIEARLLLFVFLHGSLQKEHPLCCTLAIGKIPVLTILLTMMRHLINCVGSSVCIIWCWITSLYRGGYQPGSRCSVWDVLFDVPVSKGRWLIRGAVVNGSSVTSGIYGGWAAHHPPAGPRGAARSVGRHAGDRTT